MWPIDGSTFRLPIPGVLDKNTEWICISLLKYRKWKSEWLLSHVRLSDYGLQPQNPLYPWIFKQNQTGAYSIASAFQMLKQNHSLYILDIYIQKRPLRVQGISQGLYFWKKGYEAIYEGYALSVLAYISKIQNDLYLGILKSNLCGSCTILLAFERKKKFSICLSSQPGWQGSPPSSRSYCFSICIRNGCPTFIPFMTLKSTPLWKCSKNNYIM